MKPKEAKKPNRRYELGIRTTEEKLSQKRWKMCPKKANITFHKDLYFNHTCKKNLQLLSPPIPLPKFSLARVHIAEMLHKKELFAE